jgi:hypothetical protein
MQVSHSFRQCKLELARHTAHARAFYIAAVVVAFGKGSGGEEGENEEGGGAELHYFEVPFCW